jgi:hypothetical protein
VKNFKLYIKESDNSDIDPHGEENWGGENEHEYDIEDSEVTYVGSSLTTWLVEMTFGDDVVRFILELDDELQYSFEIENPDEIPVALVSFIDEFDQEILEKLIEAKN